MIFPKVNINIETKSLLSPWMTKILLQSSKLFYRGTPSLFDFDGLARESNDFKITLKESLLISRDKPLLNKTVQSMPLELFYHHD